MRQATEREQELFRKIAQSDAYQLFASFCKLVGFGVLVTFILTFGGQWAGVWASTALLMTGIGVGYTLRGIHTATNK